MDDNNLDEFDYQILNLMKADGRVSFTEIAKKLDVAVSTVRNRYNKLVHDNVLHVIGWVDPAKISYKAYNRVTILVQPASLIENAIEELAEIEEISFIALISGPYNIELSIICRDNAHLLEVMQEKIYTIPGVQQANSTVYYKVHKWASYDLTSFKKAKTK